MGNPSNPYPGFEVPSASSFYPDRPGVDPSFMGPLSNEEAANIAKIVTNLRGTPPTGGGNKGNGSGEVIVGKEGMEAKQQTQKDQAAFSASQNMPKDSGGLGPQASREKDLADAAEHRLRRRRLEMEEEALAPKQQQQRGQILKDRAARNAPAPRGPNSPRAPLADGTGTITTSDGKVFSGPGSGAAAGAHDRSLGGPDPAPPQSPYADYVKMQAYIKDAMGKGMTLEEATIAARKFLGKAGPDSRGGYRTISPTQFQGGLPHPVGFSNNAVPVDRPMSPDELTAMMLAGRGR